MRDLRYSILLLTLALAIGARAQRPRYDKMSPMVREACLASLQARSFGAKAYSRQKSAGTLTAFVKTTGTAPLEGCAVLASFGDIHVASIPLDRLSWLSRQAGVLRIEAGRRAHTTMDTTALIVGATPLHKGVALPQAYTGQGVVVGVEDIGFDLTHPNFWSADMTRYRIKALWDQLSNDTIGSTLPAGRDYRDSIALLTLGRPRDGDTQTHGTHTAGIAAGSGSEGTPSAPRVYTGIAPDADLCLVCNATTDDIAIIDSADYYKYTYALDALGFKYIFDYADSVGKPCVINFSEGSQEDLYGDDMLYYAMLDTITGPGHIIVASAGNEGGGTNYAQKPTGTATMSLNATGQKRRLSFTTCSTADFALRIVSQDAGYDRTFRLENIITALPDSTLCDTLVAGSQTFLLTAGAYNNSYDNSLIVCDWLLQSTADMGNTTLTITGEEANVELYPVTATISSAGDNDPSIIVDNSHSILSPGSAPSVICVGSTSYRTHFTNWLGELKNYDHGTGGVRTFFSSIGPTWDGRMKPDVMAPGDNVISSYSSFYEEHCPNARDISSDVSHFTYNGRTYAWNSNAGTSMSAPVVTGVIALWLQANPRLTPQDCLNIIAETSTHYDNTLPYPNNLYGYGQIDAEAGLRLVLERATGIKNVGDDGKADGQDKVFTIDGKYVGKDVEQLPKGLYIIKGKKILVR